MICQVCKLKNTKSNIDKQLWVKWKHIYCCFVDFEKVFDATDTEVCGLKRDEKSMWKYGEMY
jgi:hypothetical protein